MRTIINILIIIFVPFIFTGIINRTKAVLAGRRGASIFQPLYDFVKLMKKGEVISGTTSFVFKIGPSIILGSVIAAAFIVPMGDYSIIDFNGNFILFAYMLALGKFFSILMAMDTGSSFEGMGASREVTYSNFVEPSFFIIIGSISAISGSSSFSKLLYFTGQNVEMLLLINVTAMFAMFVIMVVEACRVPFDDPNTHLELTMVHEVMVLDNSGPDLGYIMYAASLKMTIFAIIITDFIIPAKLPIYIFIPAILMILAVIAMAVGVVESLIARFRMSRVVEFIFSTSVFGIVIFLSVLLYKFGGVK